MWYLQIVNVCVLSLVLRVPLSPLVGADLHLSRFELPKGDVVLRSSNWAPLRLESTAPAASAAPTASARRVAPPPTQVPVRSCQNSSFKIQVRNT